MDKTTAVSVALAAAPDLPAVFTTGYTARIAAALGDRPNHFHMTGSMGLALPVGVGVALASGRLTLVVDGDGSLLMNPGGLISAGALPDLPLVHLVLDDGLYASTGGQPSPGGSVDMCAWAAATGIGAVSHVATPDTLRQVLTSAVAHCAGPVFVHCVVGPDTEPPPARVTSQLHEIAERFTRHLHADRTTGQRWRPE